MPAGWYADPWAPGAMRWWDGSAWSEHLAPAAPVVYGRTTDGYAIASLVTGIVGVPIVPIVLGVSARRRIRESGNLKDGDGLAIAGIVIGILQMAILAIVLVALLAGASASGT
jgi:hypothetical protein